MIHLSLITLWMIAGTLISYLSFDYTMGGEHLINENQAIIRNWMEGAILGLTILLIFDDKANFKKLVTATLCGSASLYALAHFTPDELLNTMVIVRDSTQGVLFMLFILVMIVRWNFSRGNILLLTIGLFYGITSLIIHDAFLYSGYQMTEQMRKTQIEMAISGNTLQSQYCNQEGVVCATVSSNDIHSIESNPLFKDRIGKGLESFTSWAEDINNRGFQYSHFSWTSEIDGRENKLYWGGIKNDDTYGVIVSDPKHFRNITDMQINGLYYSQPLIVLIALWLSLISIYIAENHKKQVVDDKKYIKSKRLFAFFIIFIVILGFRMHEILFLNN